MRLTSTLAAQISPLPTTSVITEDSNAQNPQTAIIAGAATGGAAVLLLALLIVVIILCCATKKRHRQNEVAEDELAMGYTMYNSTYSGKISALNLYRC